MAARAALRSVFEHVTLEDVATGRLPTEVAELAAQPDSWRVR